MASNASTEDPNVAAPPSGPPGVAIPPPPPDLRAPTNPSHLVGAPYSSPQPPGYVVVPQPSYVVGAQAAYVVAPQPGNGLATAGGVLGIIAVVFCVVPFVQFFSLILGILAVTFGAVGVRRAPARGGSGKGMAITGLVCGIIAVVISIVFIAVVYATIYSVTNAVNQGLQQLPSQP